MISWVGSVGLKFSYFGSRHATSVKPVGMVLDFGYRWGVCEHWLVLATCVTPMSLWTLITLGNLGASSYLDVV
jgi:hypothetical protein